MSDLVPMIPRRVGPHQSRPMLCELLKLYPGWDAPWYCVRISTTSLVPLSVVQPAAKRPMVSDPFKQASRIARQPFEGWKLPPRR